MTETVIALRCFRGSITGLGLARCDMYPHHPRTKLVSAPPEPHRSP